MLRHRIIPSLLLSGQGLVKTQKFKKPTYVGDPINAIRIFNDKEVDELLVLDIDASREKRGPRFTLIEQFASECFMPLCYGGGISSLEDAKTLFSLGVEKICLQSSVAVNQELIHEVVSQYGSQSIVASVDIKRNRFGSGYSLYLPSAKKVLKTRWQDQVIALQDSGAGEIMVNAVDRDGMRCGMDLDLIEEANELLTVPLIAAGGVGRLQDVADSVRRGADAVAVGAFCVWHGPHQAVLISYPAYSELEKML